MSNNDAPEQSDKAKPDALKTKPNGKSRTILGVAIVIALAGGALAFANSKGLLSTSHGDEYITLSEVSKIESRLENQLKNIKQSIPELVKREINEVSKQDGFGAVSKLQKQQLAEEVIRKLDIDNRVSLALKDKEQSIVEQSSEAAKASLKGDIPSLIGEYVDQVLQPYDQFNTYQVKHNEGLDTRMLDLESSISSLHTMLSSRENAIAIPEQKRTRLRGFNTLDEIADGVFSIRAPDRRGGKPHYVTLWKGEKFISVLGNHKVTGIQGKGDDAILLVGSKFYIDNDRVDYTAQELAQIRKNKEKKGKRPVTKKSSSEQVAKNTRHATSPSKTTVDHIGKLPKPIVKTQTVGVPIVVPQNQRVVNNSSSNKGAGVQYLNGRILLPDWALIVKSPELDNALVVNLNKTEGGRTQSLEKGKYYDFLGTVKEITADTVCSDTYCIGALR